MVCDKYATKKNLQNKMEITVFIISSKNIDFDHVRQTGNLLICARDRDV